MGSFSPHTGRATSRRFAEAGNIADPEGVLASLGGMSRWAGVRRVVRFVVAQTSYFAAVRGHMRNPLTAPGKPSRQDARPRMGRTIIGRSRPRRPLP